MKRGPAHLSLSKTKKKKKRRMTKQEKATTPSWSTDLHGKKNEAGMERRPRLQECRSKNVRVKIHIDPTAGNQKLNPGNKRKVEGITQSTGLLLGSHF